MAEANVVELKARAYDVLGQIEQLQSILRNINVQVAKLSQEQAPKEEPKEETPA